MRRTERRARSPSRSGCGLDCLRMLEGVFLADNLEVLRRLPIGCVDLVYIDPPFGTGQVRRLGAIRTGTGVKARKGFGGRRYSFEVVSALPLQRRHGPRRVPGVPLPTARRGPPGAAARLGPSTCTSTFTPPTTRRLLLDELFGPERFLNEVIWAYDYGGRARDRWPRKHDNILWYSKSGKWTFNIDDIDRIPYMAPGLVGPEKAARGKLPTDTWWLTIVPTSGTERTGYPTQKPLKLLERISQGLEQPW